MYISVELQVWSVQLFDQKPLINHIFDLDVALNIFIDSTNKKNKNLLMTSILVQLIDVRNKI